MNSLLSRVALIVLYFIVASFTGSVTASAITITQSGITIESDSSGNVFAKNSSGVKRMTFMGLIFTSDGVSMATNGDAASVSSVTVDGRAGIQMDYIVKEVDSGSIRTDITAVGQFVPAAGGKMDIYFQIYAPAGISDTRIRRQSANYSEDDDHQAGKVVAAQWKSDASVTRAYEDKDMLAYSYPFVGDNQYTVLDTPDAYLIYSTSLRQPIVFTESETLTNTWESQARFAIVYDLDLRPTAAAAIIAERPLAIDAWTDQPYNRWESNDTLLPLNIQAYNNSSQAKSVTISWWARDFSGETLAQGSTLQTISANAAYEDTLQITGPDRGLAFVEVSVTDGTDTAFTRTNLAVLPPYDFPHGSNQIFGLAAGFGTAEENALKDEDTIETELGLLQRMGVRSLRRIEYTDYTLAQAANLTQFIHRKTDWVEDEVSDSWLEAQLDDALAAGSPAFELDNEMNIGNPEDYVDYIENFLQPAKEKRDTYAPNVMIMNGGLAGQALTYLENFIAADGWKYLDAFAFHPGRLASTPDYTKGSWSYRGAIHNVKDEIEDNNEALLPLYLTEAYACTMPGKYDTLRAAAENIVLSYALAMAEDIEIVFWYQLKDSVWYRPDEIDPDDKEYHYGMLNRDQSPKPSLLAYATIAEVLDGASFEREMFFSNMTSHGLMFYAPHGPAEDPIEVPVAILWDRSQGYVYGDQDGEVDIHATGEPWIDPWTTTQTITLPTLGSSQTLDHPIYLETFDNPESSEQPISYLPDWNVYEASTGSATTTPKIQTADVIYSSVPPGDGLVFTHTGIEDISLSEGQDISLDMVASSSVARVQMLIQLDNDEWYVSNTEVTPAVASSWQYAKDNGIDVWQVLQFSTAAADWSTFDLTPGSPMGPGSALTNDLTTSEITGMGWYVRNTHSSWGVVARFDNLDLPSVTLMNCIGEYESVPSSNFKVDLTLTGAPTIVYGLSQYAAIDLLLDNYDDNVAINGAWKSGKAQGGFVGKDYLYDDKSISEDKSVVYTPAFIKDGTYRVELIWTANGVRDTAVPITVTHSNGTYTTTVNQQLDQYDAVWYPIGDFEFSVDAGHSITISNAGVSGIVIADAVKLTYLDD